MKAVLVALSLVLSGTVALAANGIDVSRGNDSNVYGNCVPSLIVENRSGETIDYLQVDVVLALRDGRQRTVELKSGYREGVPAPIAPGARTMLRQHLDTSRALGVPCGEVAERRVSRTICETARGTGCASSVSVQP
ncbi:hypothetical protein LJ725_08900 [Reyranella aquatilis]|uniref:Uncharacterized protein n=1 Tax=Reyranella aquatilis TaxID=2035356 RepID=A0ABS8KSM3_9HYPH|nr:hypothetical protein [Reyranella aquatilis]MCC8429082.1 hypothetical protein [Reyranella aquatilis]